MKKLLTFAGVGAIAAMLGLAAPAGATSVPITSGQTVDGYTITFPSSIQLVVDTSPAGTLVLEKAATFNTIGGLVITFDKVSSSAPSNIDINSENITNHTGSAWGEFDYVLFGGGTFTSKFNAPIGYNPGVISNGGLVVAYTGFQGAGTTEAWGPGAPDLVINDTTGVLNFKEIPVGVPLPASAWQGLVGLLGLGAVRYGKTLKAKLFA